MWETKNPISNDGCKSFTHDANEGLIFTSCEDRQVKIFDIKDGQFIESLRQTMGEKGARPIAYKKFGTKQIFNIDKCNRIDKLKKKKKSRRTLNITAEKTAEPVYTLTLKKSLEEEYNPYFFIN